FGGGYLLEVKLADNCPHFSFRHVIQVGNVLRRATMHHIAVRVAAGWTADGCAAIACLGSVGIPASGRVESSVRVFCTGLALYVTMNSLVHTGLLGSPFRLGFGW